jgi:hypothetical protein
MYESKRRLEPRCASLEAENLADSFIVFLLILAGWSYARFLLATGALKLADNCNLPPFE